MDKLRIIQKELVTLLEEGSDLQLSKFDKKGQGNLNIEYESWYTRASSAISQVIPERLSDFRQAYKSEKRKDVTYETYAISDYLIGLVVTRGGSPVFNT